jgi:hypothetical protein
MTAFLANHPRLTCLMVCSMILLAFKYEGM